MGDFRLGEALLGDFRLGETLLGEALLGDFRLGEAFLGDSLALDTTGFHTKMGTPSAPLFPDGFDRYCLPSFPSFTSPLHLLAGKAGDCLYMYFLVVWRLQGLRMMCFILGTGNSPGSPSIVGASS